MRAEAKSFIADNRVANRDVTARLKAIGFGETMEELHERDAALLALADLRVLTSTFWNRRLRTTY